MYKWPFGKSACAAKVSILNNNNKSNQGSKGNLLLIAAIILTFSYCHLQLLLQFDLVCERGSLGFVSTSVIFAGFFIGGILISIISDKFGRKLPLFTCGFFCCLFHFVSAFSPVFWVFALFRAIVGFMIGKWTLFCLFHPLFLDISYKFRRKVYKFFFSRERGETISDANNITGKNIPKGPFT